VRHFGAPNAIFYFHCQKCHVTEIYGRCHYAVSLFCSLPLSFTRSRPKIWSCFVFVSQTQQHNKVAHKYGKILWPIPNASSAINRARNTWHTTFGQLSATVWMGDLRPKVFPIPKTTCSIDLWALTFFSILRFECLGSSGVNTLAYGSRRGVRCPVLVPSTHQTNPIPSYTIPSNPIPLPGQNPTDNDIFGWHFHRTSMLICSRFMAPADKGNGILAQLSLLLLCTSILLLQRKVA